MPNLGRIKVVVCERGTHRFVLDENSLPSRYCSQCDTDSSRRPGSRSMEMNVREYVAVDALLSDLSKLELHDNTGDPHDDAYMAALADVKAALGVISTGEDRHA